MIVTGTAKAALVKLGLATLWAGRCRTALWGWSRCQRSLFLLRRHLKPPGSSVEAGRPFSAHEVLEARWKAGPVEERDLWQGLAQVCVAMTHAAPGNMVGADRLFGRAAERLTTFAATGREAYGLDLEAAVKQARSHVRRL